MDTPQAWEPLEEMLSLEPTTITEYTHKFTPEVFFWKDYAAQQAEAELFIHA